MIDAATEPKLTGARISGTAEQALPWSKAIRFFARFGACDLATVVLIAALGVMVLCTFKDYAISNDEEVQQRYGELIVAYYASGFADQSVFHFKNLYLYGGFFDVLAVGLQSFLPLDPYAVR